jgi:hypothetical protein
MRSHLLTRALRTGLAAVLVAVVGVHAAVARPLPGVRARRGFNLRAEQFTLFLVNRIACGINNIGEICVDPGNSPIGGGGFWPKGTPDQYIFNTGLQVAGIIPKNAGFAWAGDTVGAYFMDPRGTQAQGDGVTLVYNSLDPADAAAWPAGAVVRDTAVYATTLIGRNVVSQQDLWVRTWDGNPTLLSGRKHPMGVLVEERGLAWNFPSGNQDILYFIFDVTNVTASDPTVYAGLDPAIQADVAAVGLQFHDGVKAKLLVDVPAKGYRMDSVYVAFFADMDIGDAGNNYATASLPFNLGLEYKSDFKEALWKFPADIFSAPFAVAPGFIGVKYLRSPVDPATKKQIGLTIFSQTINAATGFPDPVGVTQLWRYLSGNINTAAGDNPCTQANPKTEHMCFLGQSSVDARFFQSSGPLSLDPGQSVTVVVAYVNAPAVASAITIGNIAANAPGTPATPTQATNAANIRNIDKAMGWVSAADANANGTIEQNEVVTVSGSLLQKSLVAQAIFDNKFLLPFAPEPPKFFLVPGNNSVTVVWQPSTTETIGDPFFQIAANTASPLYDPNFRSNDVEGYRVYRGRTTGDLQLVAQFDYAGTVIKDYTGTFDYGNKCAPELGLNGTANGCPRTFSLGPNYTAATPNNVSLSGNVVQIPPGGRLLLSGNTTIVNILADTAVVGGNSKYPSLTDTGVPFAFVDNGVRSSFTYYYAVTAFDINSLKSGPSSLESARITKTVTPQAGSGQEVPGKIVSVETLGADGTVLDNTAPLPTIDKATGIFSGPMPATDGLDVGLAAFVPQILADGSVTVTIDSVVPGSALTNVRVATYYITAQGAGAAVHTTTTVQFDAFSGTATNTVNFQATPLDSAQATRFGGDNGYSIYGSAKVDVVGGYRLQSFGRGDINGDPANSAQSGPRWWTGAANENTNTPNVGFCAPADGACPASLPAPIGTVPNAGALAGVQIFSIQSYSTVNNAPMRNIEGIGSNVTRAADFDWYWGANGAVDSVMDATHHVPVPFKPVMRASWGILRVSSFAGTAAASTPDGDNTRLDWTDIFCVGPSPALTGDCGGAATTPAVLVNSAALDPVAFTPYVYDGTAATGLPARPATGNGFIIYLNGHFFMMQMAALPAAGTVWHARFYSGSITGTAAAGNYKFVSAVRPPAVPGLRVKFSYQGSALSLATTDSTLLAKVHTVPDPYYATSALEISPNKKVLKFVNLPGQCIVRIYSLSGVLIQVLTHNDAQGGGEVSWDLRNRNQQFVASGVYFYHVETPDGKQKTGRFTVVNFAQ